MKEASFPHPIPLETGPTQVRLSAGVWFLLGDTRLSFRGGQTAIFLRSAMVTHNLKMNVCFGPTLHKESGVTGLSLAAATSVPSYPSVVSLEHVLIPLHKNVESPSVVAHVQRRYCMAWRSSVPFT